MANPKIAPSDLSVSRTLEALERFVYQTSHKQFYSPPRGMV